jgi:uracil-DNA glycosylase
MNHIFCKDKLYEEITQILSKHLIRSNINLDELYEKMKLGFENEHISIESCFYISKKDIFGYADLLDNKQTQNLGIDLPIYFGDISAKRRIMIVAMDPKRNGQTEETVSIGSVFALNQKKDRETKKNDYWNFIEPLTDNAFVYLTDIYKLYYEYNVLKKNQQTKNPSNKDPEFTGRTSIPFKTNKLILQAEIELIKPDTIISLGIESANALKLISDVKTTDINIVHNGINYLFMPHISRTVTQSIQTIGNLFIAMGKLKKDSEFELTGNQINKLKTKLFSK